MISCLLFEDDRPQTAKECSTHFTITGWVGEGEASVAFSPDTGLTNSVLYVPTLLFHDSGARTCLTLTSCSLKWLRNGAVLKTDELSVTRARWRDEESSPSCKLSHSKVKRKLEPSIISLVGAQSPDDVLLYIGDLQSGTELIVSIAFVLELQPSIAPDDSTSFDCIIAAMMPCHNHTMKVKMTALVPIVAVKPLSYHNNGAVPVDPSKLSTKITDSVVTCTFNNADNESTVSLFGVTVVLCHLEFTPPLKSSCFSLLLETPVIVPLDGMEKSYHGVQMLSSLPHRNLALNDWQKLTPCEMLFLVDCSGSMSGKKMHSTSEALQLAIKSLPVGCTFNVVAFGSKYRFLFQKSMEASTKYVERALQFSNQLQACLGGTELLTPLRWLLKKPLSDGLHRQLLLITDGGVPNMSDVLQIVRRYNHLTRCHTFALGPDISSELMASIAHQSGGRYVIVDEETRLQTKVMEVVKDCLQPSITDVVVTWPSPRGYTVEEPFQTPSSVWFPGTTQTCFTTLIKPPSKYTNSCNISLTPPTITGFLSGERVQGTAELDHEKTPPLSDKGAALLRNAAWFKMQSLNTELLSYSGRKRMKELSECRDYEEPPPSKKPRLNGGSLEYKNRGDLIEEIVAISLASGVSFHPYTHFKSTQSDEDNQEACQRVCQLLPWSGSTQAVRSRTKRASSQSSSSVHHRKQSRHRHRSSSLPVIPSLSSMARSTAASVTSAFKTAINVATFGLVNMECCDQSLEGGERIEDQDYYQTMEERIHWDEHNRLVFPKFYYKSHSQTDEAGTSDSQLQAIAPPNVNYIANDSEKSDDHHSDESNNEADRLLQMDMDETTYRDVSQANGTASPSFDIQPDYMALVQLQLPSGGWPLIQAISPATGVPMATILNLPTIDKLALASTGSKDNSPTDCKERGDFWASVLALTCLRVNFVQFKTEWDLLALKGEAWIDKNKGLIPVSVTEAKAMTAHLVKKIID